MGNAVECIAFVCGAVVFRVLISLLEESHVVVYHRLVSDAVVPDVVVCPPRAFADGVAGPPVVSNVGVGCHPLLSAAVAFADGVAGPPVVSNVGVGCHPLLSAAVAFADGVAGPPLFSAAFAFVDGIAGPPVVSNVGVGCHPLLSAAVAFADGVAGPPVVSAAGGFADGVFSAVGGYDAVVSDAGHALLPGALPVGVSGFSSGNGWPAHYTAHC